MWARASDKFVVMIPRRKSTEIGYIMVKIRTPQTRDSGFGLDSVLCAVLTDSVCSQTDEADLNCEWSTATLGAGTGRRLCGSPSRIISAG